MDRVPAKIISPPDHCVERCYNLTCLSKNIVLVNLYGFQLTVNSSGNLKGNLTLKESTSISYSSLFPTNGDQHFRTINRRKCGKLPGVSI